MVKVMRNILLVSALLVSAACAEPATSSVASAVTAAPSTFMIGSWDCKILYLHDATIHQDQHTAHAFYTVIEDHDEEATLGDGTVVIRGQYAEDAIDGGAPLTSYTDVWHINPKADPAGKVSYILDVAYTDLRTIHVPGTFSIVNPASGFQGFGLGFGLLRFPNGGTLDNNGQPIPESIELTDVLAIKSGQLLRDWEPNSQLASEMHCDPITPVSARTQADPGWQDGCDPSDPLCQGNGGSGGVTCDPASCTRLSDCGSSCYTCAMDVNKGISGVCH